MIGHIIFLISFASVVLMTAYLSTTAEYYRRKSENLKIVADFVKEANEQIINRLLNNRSLIFLTKENVKNVREKLFNILTEYEIGNYDNNTHQFYEDVYNVHNELMELAE